MKNQLLKLLVSSLLVLMTFSGSLHADEDIPKNLIKIQLDSFTEKNKTLLALTFNNHEGWHTYWKNPGDAGLPIKVQLFVDQGKKEFPLKDLEWPVPKKYRESGDQIGFGYSGTYTFFYEFSKAEIQKLEKKSFNLKASWLICKHVCIPGELTIPGEIQNGQFLSALSSGNGPQNSDLLKLKLEALPKVEPVPNYLTLELIRGKEDKALELRATINQKIDQPKVFENNLLLAFPLSPFDFQHEEFYRNDFSFMALTPIGWDGEYSTPVIDLPQNGVFKKPYTIRALFYDPIIKRTYIIEKTFKSFSNQYQPVPSNLKKWEYVKPGKIPNITDTKKAANEKREDSSLFYYIVLGFVGGLILNIMPCVLPVISLKLFELIKYRQESRKSLLRHNIFYTLGILATFLVLALSIVGLKSIGTDVGWGFQLQSPKFIMIMVIALFVFSLNLFGLFEFSTPGGKYLGNVKTDSPFVGDFVSGILATVLSTPCSAPFLGTALTFAFSASIASIIAVFSAIGVGLAFPFILTGFFPRLIHFFPKPGMWMITFKKVMGFSLILTIIWLLDVYSVLVEGSSDLSKLLVLLTMIFFGFFITKEKYGRTIIALLSATLFLFLWNSHYSTDNQSTNSASITNSTQLKWEPWSKENMVNLKNKNELVFMDFTAKWCFTCKVNEKVVLESSEFKDLVKEKNLKLLLADWTKRDEKIGSFLKEQGLVGVPAYFIQKPDGTLINLGETITVAKIRKNLE